MRLAGQAKMGYYPTPEPVARAISHSLVRSKPGLLRVLDPCCGEGTALRLVTETLGDPVERYGIELNRTRAAAAKATLTHVLATDLRAARIAHHAFSVLLLNPPYDFSERRLDEAAERLELHFLQASLRYLQTAGVLLYLIPDRRLERRIAGILSYYLEQIQVFRFPGELYQPFKQILIFGTRKRTPFRHDEALQRLRAIGHGMVIPPDLPDTLATPYTVPCATTSERILFQNLAVDPEELLAEITQHGLYPTMLRDMHPPTEAQAIHPLMPLRRGHLALVLATGYLNNEIVQDPENGQRFLVKGRTEKDTVRSESTEEDGTVVITDRDVLKIVVTALDLDTGTLHSME